MRNGVTGKVVGADTLARKLAVMKANFDGPPLQKVCLQGARLIASQAKRNARRGPTGNVIKAITAVAGKKASRFGAMAIAKAGWKGSGAVFEEWGTKERIFNTMKIPFSKLVGIGRGKRATLRGPASGRFGLLFSRKAAPMAGTRFFENAVESEMPKADRLIMEGCQKLIEESIR